jgi:hypothetical protein
MLRSALVAAFSAALAFGALTGHAETKTAVAQDSSWRVQATAAGDSSWAIVASDAPGDSSWVAPAVPGDSSWVAPADSSWAVQS